MAAAVAFALYRAIPRDPDAGLGASIAQQLRFEYSARRAPEMQARAAERAGEALLAVTDDVLNARIELDGVDVRGPLLPPPLPRWVVAHVRYRVMKGTVVLEANDRCLVFDRSGYDDWRLAGERRNLLTCLSPV